MSGPQTPLIYDDNFCGVGMVSAALLPAGWACRYAIDNDRGKASVYRENWGSDGLIVGSIEQLGPGDIPPGRADLSWASFPCKDTSEAGPRIGLEGERSGLVWSYLELTAGLKAEGRAPKLIALENVTGWITGHKGRDFLAAVTSLAGLGYAVGAVVLDASHWLPQERKRVFVVAVAEDIPIPAGLVGLEPGLFAPAYLRKAVGSFPPELREKWRWWNLPTPPKRNADLCDIVVDTPAWDGLDQTAALVEMISPASKLVIDKAMANGERIVGAGFRRTRNGRPQFEARFDGLAGCLRTAAGGSSRQILLAVEGAKIRTRLISPRECARLMGLRDTFKLPPARNDALSVVGDGIAIPCVEFLDRHLLQPLLRPALGDYAMVNNTPHVEPALTPLAPKARAKKKGNGREPVTPAPLPSAVQMDEEMARLAAKLPEYSEAAPAAVPSQDAVPLNALFQTALAPGAVDFDAATTATGPVEYTSLQRRRPRGDEVFRLLPPSYGTTMVYMLPLSREAKGKGEHDAYIVTPNVRSGVISQPHIVKRIRRVAICVAVNTFGSHFITEIDMDSTTFQAQVCRDWARLAVDQWMNVFWDEGKKQHVIQRAADQSMPVVVPSQSFNTLLNLTYDESTFIKDLDHKVLRRLWIA